MTTLEQYRQLFDLTGKTAVVIGAASGIGEASARALAAHGANVVCADLNSEMAGAVADGIVAEGGKASSCPVDITDATSVEGVVADAGQVDNGVVDQNGSILCLALVKLLRTSCIEHLLEG